MIPFSFHLLHDLEHSINWAIWELRKSTFNLNANNYLISESFSMCVWRVRSKIPCTIIFTPIMRPVTEVKRKFLHIVGAWWVCYGRGRPIHVNDKLSIAFLLATVVWLVKKIFVSEKVIWTKLRCKTDTVPWMWMRTVDLLVFYVYTQIINKCNFQ